MCDKARLLAALFAFSLSLTACERSSDDPAGTTGASQTREGAGGAATSQTSHAGLNIDDPDTCATCHSTIVEEWRTSMHANAHHDNDALYGAMRDFRIQREGEELATRCSNCHSPRAPQAPDSAVALTGVSCAGCHNIASIDRGDGSIRGARAIRYEAGTLLRGPHDIADDAAAPHSTGDAAPWINDGETLCMVCHESSSTPHGLPSCTTGFEFADASAEQSCAGCHMPVVDGPSGLVSARQTHRSHAFLGPNQVWRGVERAREFMATSVQLDAAFDGTALTATIENQTAHSFPTGFPGRMALLKVIGFDEAGVPIWSNFSDDPMSEDPDAVFNKVYVNDEGQPVMPPYGTELRRDSRLGPNESRELTWEVPGDVTSVELKVLFRLVPPPAAQAIGLGDSELAQPRVILTERLER